MKKIFAVLCMVFIFCGQVEAAGALRNGRLWEQVINNSRVCKAHGRHNCGICFNNAKRQQNPQQNRQRQSPAKQMKPRTPQPSKMKLR